MPYLLISQRHEPPHRRQHVTHIPKQRVEANVTKVQVVESALQLAQLGQVAGRGQVVEHPDGELWEELGDGISVQPNTLEVLSLCLN